MRDFKLYRINYLYHNIISELPDNSLDDFLCKSLQNQFFGNNPLSKVYEHRGFNSHCRIGSLLCSLNFPLPCTLVRGELLSDYRGNKFSHGWIETTYQGKEYVIDTSFVKAVPKDTYYKFLTPKIKYKVDRDFLLHNPVASFLKDEVTHPNQLTFSKIYTIWSPFENKSLQKVEEIVQKVKKVF